jgi:SAM-dependent methyltransferase
VCAEESATVIATYTPADAASYLRIGLDPPPDRAELERILAGLWEPVGRAETRRCGTWGFGFAWPHVAGGGSFYDLRRRGAELSIRSVEFERTVRALRARPAGTLLEVGAGAGWFLRQFCDELDASWACEALEYSRGAVRQLRDVGFEAKFATIDDLVTDRELHGHYTVICLFQTLEHMDHPHRRIADIRRLLAPASSLFLSSEWAAIDIQEQLAGLPDTPPNHVGRWTTEALERVLRAEGFEVLQSELGPAPDDSEVMRLAHYAMLVDRERGRSPLSWMARRARGRLRSLLEALLVRRHSRRIARASPELPPADIWVHARARDQARGDLRIVRTWVDSSWAWRDNSYLCPSRLATQDESVPSF